MYTSTHIHILKPVVLGCIDRPHEYMERSLKFYMCVSVVWACFIALVHEQLIGVRVSSLLPPCGFWGRNSGNQAYWHYVPSTQKTFKAM